MKLFDPAKFIESTCRYPVDFFYVSSLIESLSRLGLDKHAQNLLDALTNIIDVQHHSSFIEIPRELVVDIPIIDHCNLSCAGCSHRAPLIHNKELRHIIDITKDLEALNSINGSVPITLYILGGEPLLHPNLTDILHVARSIFNYSKICITTNMVLYENGSPLEKTLLEHNIVLRYSSYPGISDKAQLKIDAASSLGISVELSGESPAMFYNYRISSHVVTGSISHRSCRLQYCPVLRDGKFWLCGHMPYANHITDEYGVSMPDLDYNYVNLADIDSLDELLVLLALPHPCCSYCHASPSDGWRSRKPLRSDYVLD